MKIISTFSAAVLAGPADYTVQGDNWVEVCATGESQSPINIDSSTAQSAMDSDPFKTENWFSTFDWEVAYQTGFTPLTDQIYTLGGQLDTNTGVEPAKWRLAQFHLHWGGFDENDIPEMGSEHTFNGEQFFSEVHFVHYNTKYADLGEAVDKADGLVVLGYFIKGTDADYNTDLDDLIQTALQNVADHEASQNGGRKRKAVSEESDGWTNIVQGSAFNVVDGNFKNYYRYSGSLTTPGCFESVQWTVFDKPLTVNAQTVEMMRSSSDDTSFNNNWRNTQPLYGRQVTYYEPVVPVCAGVDIFKLECLGDFKVKLTVVEPNCFSTMYPDIFLTDLVVFDDDSSSVLDADSCTAFEAGKSGSNYFYSDIDLTAPVSPFSSALYFDGKVCASDATWDGSSLSYSAKVGSYMATDNEAVLFTAEMVSTTLTCTYENDIEKEIEIDETKIDTVETEDKVAEASPSSLEITTTISTLNRAGDFEQLLDGSDVILGQEVKVTFATESDILPVHIQSCFAKDAATGETNSLTLVAADCFQSGTAALDTINPQEGTTQCLNVCSTELTFNQFAFVASDDATLPTLTFHMECEIAIGEAECGRRRRQAAGEEAGIEKVTLDYRVQINQTEINELDDGVVVLLENSDSSAAAVTSGLLGLVMFAL